MSINTMSYDVKRTNHTVHLSVPPDADSGLARYLEWSVKADLWNRTFLAGTVPGPSHIQELVQLRDDIDRAIKALAAAFPGAFVV